MSIKRETIDWIRRSTTLFYAHHYPDDKRLHAVLEIQKDWNVPSFATEVGGGPDWCSMWKKMADVNMSRTYWKYSHYCNAGRPSIFGLNASQTPNNTFGACILGWHGSGPNSGDYLMNKSLGCL